MKEKPDVLQGTLALMVLKTLDILGPQHGYGIARRVEQISGDLLAAPANGVEGHGYSLKGGSSCA
jgi:DNA-binding PadR family transcriptional regulator